MDNSFSFSDPDTSLGSGAGLAAAGADAGLGLGGYNDPSTNPNFGMGPQDWTGSGGAFEGDFSPMGGDFGWDGFSAARMGDPSMGPPAPPQNGGSPETPWYENPYFKMGLKFLARKNPLTALLSLGWDAYNSKGKSALGMAGGVLGSQLGGNIAGPAGAFLGGQAGAKGLPGIAGPVGGATEQNVPGQGGMQPGQSSGSNPMSWNRVGQDLLGLYGNYRQGRTAQNNVNQLQGLYSPGSPYAQQMAQSLARRDAQAGRRSQYGTREVELAAKLASLQSANAPAINQQRQVADDAKMRNLQLLFNLGGAAAPGVKNFINDSTWWS